MLKNTFVQPTCLHLCLHFDAISASVAAASQGKTVCDLKRCSHVVITYKITCDSVCDHIRKITYGKSHRASHTVNHIR